MKRLLFFTVIAWCGGGCLISVSDPAAEWAAGIYHDMHLELPEGKYSLASALAKVDKKHAGEVRVAFAVLAHTADREDIDSLAKKEKARVKLNVLLGYLPGDSVKYDLNGAWECPAELPPVSQLEKAALISNPHWEVLTMLKTIRLAHVDALAAMRKYGGKSPEYLKAVIELARVTKVEFRELYDLSEYEQRFDAAWKRQEKIRKSGKE